jgi:hypothetical protein
MIIYPKNARKGRFSVFAAVSGAGVAIAVGL